MAKKSKDIDAIMLNLEKIVGVKGIMKNGDETPEQGVISFDYPDIDTASSCGGVPKGKLIEIFGEPSGGKSYLSLKLIASAQKQGIGCVLVDAEQSYSKSWAEKHGVDISKLKVISAAICAEKLLDAVVYLCSIPEYGLIVVDSTAALVPEKELEGSVGDQDYALLARAMSKACKKIANACGDSNSTCVFLNQVREKMASAGSYGANETTPGGKALKFFASQRIQVTPGKVIKVMEGEKEVVVARKSYVRFVKNKSGSPFGQCEMEIVFNETSLNPVVRLCALAKDAKLLTLRLGKFGIKAEVIDVKKNLDTGASTFVELADYVVNNDYTMKILDAYLAYCEENAEEPDKSVASLKEHPELAISPIKGMKIKVEEIVTEEDAIKNADDDKGDDSEPEA